MPWPGRKTASRSPAARVRADASFKRPEYWMRIAACRSILNLLHVVSCVDQIQNPNLETRKERESMVGCRGENPLSRDTYHSTPFLLFDHLDLFRLRISCFGFSFRLG